jgi:digeranylgeranylglycerophospholipid reductase
MTDVHVIGAGPAGSIAAMAAARHGHRVVVSEQHGEAGRHATCSGLFSAEGLRSLSQFIDHRKLVVNRIRGADIHFADEVLSVRTKEPVAYVCDRHAFDARLAENAESEGAKIIYNEIVKGRFRADCVIGADGPSSSVAMHFRFPPMGRYVCTMKAVMEYDVAAKTDKSIIAMHLSQSRFPGFFGWMIPHANDLAEFGVGVALPGSALAAWNHLLGMYGVRRPRSVASDIIPVEPRRRTSMRSGRHRVLLTGDAAGQVKATTGGGVVFGGNCAALAGKHADNPHGYELEWRSRFGPDLFLHRKIRDHLDGLPDHRLSGLARNLKRLRLESYLSRHGSMDKPTRMIKPQMLSHLAMALAGLE